MERMPLVRVKVPATTANLGPGFDCLGMALELYNTVEMNLVPNGCTIEVHGEGAFDIARDGSNIVYQAALLVFQKLGIEVPGLRIRLFNRIPVARGLGSSAAAVVGGILAANRLSGNKLSLREMLMLASGLEGHPDNVSPAFLGGLVITAPAEGEIKYMQLAPPQGIKLVLAIPEFPLSTRMAREVLPQQVAMADAVYNLSRVALLVASLLSGDFSHLNTAVEDKLHQPFRAQLVPGMKKVMAAAKLAGARGVALSGAGPSLAAFADENFDLIARVMRETFRESGIIAKTLVLAPCPVGASLFESR